jgi:hypothetical protein
MPDDDSILSEWLAEVEALQRRLDPDLSPVMPDALRPYVYALRQSLIAVRRAREHEPPDPTVILEQTIYLAKDVEAALAAEHDHWMEEFERQVSSWQEYADALERELDEVGGDDVLAVSAKKRPPRGRPPRSGFEAQDADLVAQMMDMMTADPELTPWQVARELAPRAAGGSTLENKARRLVERYWKAQEL